MIRKQLYLCCVLLLLFPCLAQASGHSTFERLYQSAEPLLSILTDSQGTVLAEVDGFPILQEDINFIFALDQALDYPTTKDAIFNNMLEDRAVHSQAQAMGLLPADEEVATALEKRRSDVLFSDEDAQEQLDLLYAALAVSADEYWYGFEKYNQFHLLVSSRLYETLIEQGRAAKAPYLDDYYAQKLLEWKQACPLTLSPDCPYTPITDTLVKPMPHGSHLTLYGDSEHATALDNKQIKQQIRSDFLSSRTILFVLAACVLILLYAFLCHRIKK